MKRRWAENPSRARLPAVVVAALALAVVLGGCGGGGSTATQPAPAASSAGPASTEGSTDATSPSAGASASEDGDCGGAAARVTSAVSSFSEVTKVTMIAACGQVSVETKLPPGVLGSASATKGAKICAAAAKVAYQGDVSSVTVTSADGHELAIGLKGADCLPG